MEYATGIEQAVQYLVGSGPPALGPHPASVFWEPRSPTESQPEHVPMGESTSVRQQGWMSDSEKSLLWVRHSAALFLFLCFLIEIFRLKWMERWC